MKTFTNNTKDAKATVKSVKNYLAGLKKIWPKSNTWSLAGTIANMAFIDVTKPFILCLNDSSTMFIQPTADMDYETIGELIWRVGEYSGFTYWSTDGMAYSTKEQVVSSLRDYYKKSNAAA